jgi:hypothetical protein
MERVEEGNSAFLSAVKSALEEGAGDVSCWGEIQRAAVWRSRLRLLRAGVSLLAAMLLAIFSFMALHMRAAAQERNVAQVIGLLRASEGVESEAEGESVAEMLLAWQDIPYENALASFAPAE